MYLYVGFWYYYLNVGKLNGVECLEVYFGIWNGIKRDYI